MDQPPGGQQPVRTIVLKHANADEVAQVLTAMFSGAAGRGGAAGRSRRAPGGGPAAAGSAVVIQADAKSRTLLIRADDETFAKIEQLATKLDVPATDQAVIKMYPVKNADVQAVASAVQQIFARSPASVFGRYFGRSGGRAGGAEVPVTVVPDEAARKVIVSASADKHELIAKVIEEMDSTQSGGPVSVVVYRLQNADARAVATALSSTLASGGSSTGGSRFGRFGRGGTSAGGAAQLRISADTSSNSLVVRASQSEHAKIAKLIAEMDAAPAAKYPVRVITLQHAEADQMAELLRSLFEVKASSNGPRPRGVRGPKGRTGPTSGGRSDLVIEADPKARMLLIRTDDETFARLQAIVQQLDVASAELPVVKIYPVKNADIPMVVDALQRIFGQGGGISAARSRSRRVLAAGAEAPVTVIGDENTRKVIVAAPQYKHSLIAKTIEEIDASQTGQAVTVQVYRLEHADATTIAQALTTTLSGASGGTGRTMVGRGRSAATSGAGNFRITADASSNSLVVRGSADVHKQVADLLAKLDKPPAAEYPVRTIALKNADPDEMASAVAALFGSPAAGRARRGRWSPPAGQSGMIVQANRTARALMVRADDETFKKIQELVAKLDVSATGRAVPTVIALTHARAEDVAGAIQASFAPQRGQRLSPDDAVTVVPEPTTNSLIVTANESNLQKVQALLAKLDTAEAGGNETEFLVLKNARATDMASMLQRIAAGGGASGGYKSRRGVSATGRGGGGVIVSAEPASNAVVFSGPEQDVKRLLDMAKQLDAAAEATAVPVVKMYPVKNADIPTVVDALRQIFSSGSAQGRGTSYRSRGRTSAGAGQGEVTIIGDEVGGRIIVAAPQEKHALIAKTIEEMDAKGLEEAVVKVYRLRYADAASISTALEAALVSGSTGRGGSFRGRGQAATPGRLRISPDRSSNSLVVRATPADHAKIAELLQEMDAPPAEKYPVRTIALNNADATEAANILNSLFGQAGGKSASRGGRSRYGQGAAAGGSVIIQPGASGRILLVR
ncbi:MAG: hypothetical protein J7M21_02250, partial [Planctomycetes bacterium]|nr:hypothetical protein [Planctomycetota bacterium]